MLKKSHIVAAVLLSFAVLTGHWQTGVVCAAEKKKALNTKADHNAKPEKAVAPHTAHVRFHFQDPEMDFVFGSLILGATVNHGCEIGEAFRTAAGIKDGSVKDGVVSFKTVRQFNGNEFTTSYSGKLEGDTLKLKSESEANGQKRTRDIEAKRAPATAPLPAPRALRELPRTRAGCRGRSKCVAPRRSTVPQPP